MFKALKEDRFIEFQTEAHSARDSKVWTANFMGNRMVYSSEPENMKALSTLQKDCFTVEPIRVAYGAITPFTGRGVSSSDDAKWQSSRDLVKPYFERAGFSNLERLSRHVGRLLSKIPMKRKVTMISGGSRWLEDVLI
jgi:cytochrome P450 monooxygenase